ncbi:MAG: translation elongation factor 4 [bacterium]|nr:translation elongation factor 4 [bacterium]
MDTSRIRNFCIIAHIDHGKSTLADRLLELTHTIAQRNMREQVLDNMDLERERGITIKSHPVRLVYKRPAGDQYVLNLIDTPGHVDFTYEVSRSLAACEGALLLVDATQGVQAQTIANLHLAQERGIKLIPVINKIDLSTANVPLVRQQIREIIHLPTEDIIEVSAKYGTNVQEVLDAIVARIPPPPVQPTSELRALIFDSVFNNFRGVVVYARVFSGHIEAGLPILLMSTGKSFEVAEIGSLCPDMRPTKSLATGEVGYVIANIKDPGDVRIGDTITARNHPARAPIKGYKEMQPMVFSGLYPLDASDYEALREALGRLRLNDASFVYEPESSAALGYGFRCGFLGLLHLEVIFQRIEREFGISTISTNPSVSYRVQMKGGELRAIDNPTHFPNPAQIERVEEPYVLAYVIIPNEYIGPIMQLAMERRGECVGTDSMDPTRVMLKFEVPLNEIIVDFYDKLKSLTRGYGSLDYEYIGHRPSDMVKLDILVNHEPVDAFSGIVHTSKADSRGRAIVARLKEVIPKQLFSVPIQAAIGGRIVARETIKALKKDVTAKCYGGDITRKRKLWEKQKEGKKKLKEVGKVRIPQSAFIEVLKAGA